MSGRTESHSWDESALPEAKSVTYTPAVQNSIQVDGVLDVPAALKGALDGRNRALFFQFKHPLTDEDMDMVEFLAIALEGVLSGMLEDSYYFRAAWYPGEGDSYILGLLLESHRIEEEESDGIDAGSPEGGTKVGFLCWLLSITLTDSCDCPSLLPQPSC